jgi:hypothetical protein
MEAGQLINRLVSRRIHGYQGAMALALLLGGFAGGVPAALFHGNDWAD